MCHPEERPKGASRRAALIALLFAVTSTAHAFAATRYTLPQDVRWIPYTKKGVPAGAYYAYIRGKPSDKFGESFALEFRDGYHSVAREQRV